MKELSIEEKVKAYDEAIAHAKKLLKIIGNATLGNLVLKNEFERMFPELKESEGERMMNIITKALCTNAAQEEIEKYGINAIDCVAWLEKQGEQKPADKVEPKFKVGDWVVNKAGDINQIVKVSEDGFTRDDDLYINDSWAVNYHLWTIQDAKKGDVLVNDKIIIIVDHLGTFENSPIIYSWYFADSKKFYGMGPSEPDRWAVEGFIPATKEQCDLLFKKMQEAGYEWDTKNLKLKKIEQKPSESLSEKELVESYLAVFDKKYPILPTLKGKQLADFKNFLNKCQQEFGLKEYGIHPAQAKLFEKLTLLWATWGAEHLQGIGKSEIEDKPAWSEEDEKIKESIITGLEMLKEEASDKSLITLYDKKIDWLKSLKERYTWKPSDEQMQALSNAGNSFRPFEEGHKVLWSLYNDLKKLREE